MNLQLMDDPRFVQMAIKLGYTRQELGQINMQSIEAEAFSILKGMSELEKGYYLKKKFEALQARQQKIYQQINEELRRQGLRKPRRSYHPVTTKMIIEHQQAIDKKQRYQKIRQLHTRDKMKQRHNKTIDLGKTSPNFSHVSYNSRVSRENTRSASSNRSRSSVNSHKLKLQIVRQKQKDEEQFKKYKYLQNEDKSKQRLERVRQSRKSLSRRLQTKSEITEQAVKEKKTEIHSIRDQQIREHIEKTKYQMIRNEYIKQKQLQNKQKNNSSDNVYYKCQLKKMFEENRKQANQQRYQTKMKSASMKKRQIQMQRAQTLELKKKEELNKQNRVHRYQEHIEIQQNQNKVRTLFYESQSQQKAKQLKNEIQSEKKMKLLETRVKQEITKTNYNTIERRRKLQTQEKTKRMSQRVNQIRQFEDFKKNLEKERVSYGYSRNSHKRERFSFY